MRAQRLYRVRMEWPGSPQSGRTKHYQTAQAARTTETKWLYEYRDKPDTDQPVITITRSEPIVWESAP